MITMVLWVLVLLTMMTMISNTVQAQGPIIIYTSNNDGREPTPAPYVHDTREPVDYKELISDKTTLYSIAGVIAVPALIIAIYATVRRHGRKDQQT